MCHSIVHLLYVLYMNLGTAGNTIRQYISQPKGPKGFH
jgi:hypothetical protein